MSWAAEPTGSQQDVKRLAREFSEVAPGSIRSSTARRYRIDVEPPGAYRVRAGMAARPTVRVD